MMFDLNDLVKYLVQGLAVAAAAWFISNRTLPQTALMQLALATAVSYAILDRLAPSVALGTRLGTGVGLGMKLAGGGEDY